MTKVHGLVFLLTSLPLAIACGSSSPPPAAAPAEPSAPAASASPPSSEPAPTAASSSATEPTTPAPSAEPSAPPAKPPVVLGETKDECTPVSVDFEKRARPKIKECYAAGKKRDPNLEGTVKIKVTVDLKGKIKSTKVIEKTLPNTVADCMLKAVKATPFPEVEKCWDASLTIPITFPTPN